MNPSFDLLVIVIGVLATVVGVIVLFRMMRSSKEEPETTSSAATHPQAPPSSSTRPYLRISPKRPGGGKITQEYSNKDAFLSASEKQQVVTVSQPNPLTEEIPVDSGPYLSNPKVSQPKSNMLRLTLSVVQDVLIYEKLSLGEWNELQVSYEPPIFRKKESYAPGTALNFHISGDNLDTSTYQFSVHYQDNTGRAYRQEIGGMGSENPIVEGPIAIGNWQ